MIRRPLIFVFLVIFFYSIIRLMTLQENELDRSFSQKALCKLEGRITQIVPKEKTTAIHLKHVIVKELKKEEVDYSKLNSVILYYTSSGNLKIGNTIQVTGTIEKFQTERNPGQFNEYLYYKSSEIDYKIFGDKVEVQDASYDYLAENLRCMHEKLASTYQNILGKDSGVIRAMVLGERSAIDCETKELYQKNGIAHILAISGLHISMIGMLLYEILKKIYLPNETVIPLAIITLVLYAELTNAGSSTNRAVLMLAISLIGKLIGRTYDSISAMCLSGSITLIQCPLQISNSGFLLSYGAVIAIATVYPTLNEIFFPAEKAEKLKKETRRVRIEILFYNRKRAKQQIETKNQKRMRSLLSKILKGILFSFSINVVTAPIILYFYYDIPIYSILLNLCIIPFLSFLLATGIVSGVIGTFSVIAGVFTGGSVHIILWGYETLCNFFLELPGSIYTVGKPSIITIFIYYGCLAFFLASYYFTTNKKTIFICFGMLVLFYKPISSELTVTMLDVGQGDGILIENTSGKNYFIDGGSTSIKQLGKYRITPCLKSKGIVTIDYAFITHVDQDHISGIMELLEGNNVAGNIKIGHLVMPDTSLIDDAYNEMIKLANEKNIPIVYLKKGDVIQDQELRLTCLHPYKEFQTNERNNYSTVLWLQYNSIDMLFTGDVSEEGEDEILKTGLPQCEVLKVAHHGSKYTNSVEMLEQVRPRYALISSGEGNDYGHPHQEVLERLEDVGAKILRTDECGAITILVKKDRMIIKKYLTNNSYSGNLGNEDISTLIK